MKLEVTPIPVISHPRMTLQVKFMVSNEGSRTERILVFMSEALEYIVSNSKQRFTLGAGQNITGHFNVMIRDAIGKNVVITITSEIEGGDRRTSTQYDTVETTILEKREIIKPPVKQNPPRCDFEIPVSSTEECIKSFEDFSCCRHRWSAVINAEASSDFSPIVNMVSSMSSNLSSYQNISAGVVAYRANISNDCCTDRDTVYVRDTKNQIGKCFLQVVPPFLSFNTTCRELPPKKVPLVCNLYTTMEDTTRCIDSHKDFNCCRQKWSAILKVKNGSNPAPIVNVTSSMSSVIIANENLTDSAFLYEAEISNDCCVKTDTIYVTDAKDQTGNCTLHIIPDSTSTNSTCKELKKEFQSHDHQPNLLHNTVALTLCNLLVLIFYQI
ncbi:uncharacterized protein LOC106883840 [Octopus bimaculoides]|uniref:uncharacterized protein LOC106883840 n=1 Tax=Octopus bimaculoides TaxID=37653 RepID=UPI00071CBDA7|nr:uncharacterized protein LOC106883840 [Octopus bimaculoides]|eukprot:XP_014790464.1 PREDICTED: uncharacterized protein LOC106883840 [Octopus bimaculoides]